MEVRTVLTSGEGTDFGRYGGQASCAGDGLHLNLGEYICRKVCKNSSSSTLCALILQIKLNTPSPNKGKRKGGGGFPGGGNNKQEACRWTVPRGEQPETRSSSCAEGKEGRGVRLHLGRELRLGL